MTNRNRDAQIYEEYQNLVTALEAAKEEIGTVDALAKKYGISRQRLYKIVAKQKEMEEAKAS